ncbi:hypothetical protein SH449x_000710 [Pirellulaceae bacterium SH449]
MSPYDLDFQIRFDEILRLLGIAEAATFARNHVENDANIGIHHECLGIALWLWKRAPEAIVSIVKARCLGTVKPTTDLIYIQCLASVGQRRTASRVLKEFLRQQDISEDHLESLASKLGKVQEFALALQVCQYLVNKNAANPDAWYGIAFYQERLGCAPQMLLTPLRRAVLFSGSICARVHLARVLFSLEELPEAYVLVRFIPIEAIDRLCWAHTIFQIALAQQDFLLAEKVRAQLAKLYECSLVSQTHL